MELELLLTEQEIQDTVKRLGREIRPDYEDKNPIVLGVLKGSFMFVSDLTKQLSMPLEVDFITLSSYDARKRTGNIKVERLPRLALKDRHILVVEDIVDTGRTMDFLIKWLKKKKVASIGICVLLDDPSRRSVEIVPDYRGFPVYQVFAVGYGLDCSEKYRNFNCIYQVKDSV